MLFLSKNLKNLKKINCLIGASVDDYIAIDKSELNRVARKLRSDLDVSVFNIKFTKKAVSVARDFFVQFRSSIIFEQNKCTLVVKEESIALIQFIKKNEDLFVNFYESITLVVFYKKLADNDFFKKLVNCRGADFRFDNQLTPDNKEFLNALKILPITSNLYLHNNCLNVEYSNKIFSRMVVFCRDIDELSMDQFTENINYNFILKFKRLKILNLRLMHAIDQSIFIKIFRALKDLCLLEIYFIKPANMEKEQLSAFKKLVTNHLKEKIKIKDFNFIIQIFENRGKKVIRCYYTRGNLRINFKDYIVKNDYGKLFDVVQPGCFMAELMRNLRM